MLASFTVEHFKSYQGAATLKFAPLTILIGANASGKSNVVEALRLLSWIAQGNKLSAIAHTVQGGDQAIRGKVEDLGFRNASWFQLGCQTTHPEWDAYSIRLLRRGDDELHIASETLTGTNQTAPLFDVADANEQTGNIRVAYNNFAHAGRKPQVACNDQMSVLVQLQSSARFADGHRKSQQVIPTVTSEYLSWMSNVVFLDPRPSLMRGYSFKTDQRLESSGSNLSGVLYGLCEEPTRKARLLDLVKALPEQDIEDLDFIETPRNEAMVRLTETFGGCQATYDATLLSDGTLRVLAIGAALLSAPEGSLVVIEEIDNGVHPSRAGLLLEHIADIAKHRSLRVLISSHDPALLDATPNEAVGDVAFCYRDGETGASRLTRLADLAAYPSLVARAPLGRLMTQGAIDRFVKQMHAPEVRRRKAKEWLERVRHESN